MKMKCLSTNEVKATAVDLLAKEHLYINEDAPDLVTFSIGVMDMSKALLEEITENRAVMEYEEVKAAAFNLIAKGYAEQTDDSIGLTSFVDGVLAMTNAVLALF